MIKRFALMLLVTALGFAGAAVPARASDAADVVAAVRHAVAAFNAGDSRAFVGACTSPAIVIDDFAPHIWQGATACADWAAAFAVEAKSESLTDGVVTLGKPKVVTVTGKRAYAVFPATFTYKAAGKPQTEGGATYTFVLAKTAAGWKFAAWAWAGAGS